MKRYMYNPDGGNNFLEPNELGLYLIIPELMRHVQKRVSTLREEADDKEAECVNHCHGDANIMRQRADELMDLLYYIRDETGESR